jgi:hypothetical protein
MSQAELLSSPELESCIHDSSKWEQERIAYWRLLPELISQYRGQYVAVHGGEVVDSGPDQVEVALRVYRKFGYVPIYVGLVSNDPVRMLRVPTPRVLQGVGRP